MTELNTKEKRVMDTHQSMLAKLDDLDEHKTNAEYVAEFLGEQHATLEARIQQFEEVHIKIFDRIDAYQDEMAGIGPGDGDTDGVEEEGEQEEGNEEDEEDTGPAKQYSIEYLGDD